MASNKNHKTFGEYFTALMRERGFKSDEQLARRAMQVQEQLAPRVNVQRRTINNWRNDKSTPRSLDDQQFRLVALALKLSDDELGQIAQFINIEITSRDDVKEVELVGHEANRKLNQKYWFAGGATAMLIIAAIVYFFASNNQNVTYLDQIPPTQLRVSVSGFVIPNSDTQVVSERQLEQLSGWELYVARNEIFARKGRPFVKVSSMCLQRHFDRWTKSDQKADGWYSKRSGDVRLTDLEYRNAEIIRNYECKARGGQYNCSGQLNQCY
ncbi:MAG: YARHG domain-containing protein [Lentilitoribacter sp.]